MPSHDAEILIGRDQMFPLLLEAEPAFQPMWNEFIAEWQGDVDLPLYLALSELARHLIRRVQANETATFSAIFDVVERWHLEGDDYVREAASIGLLEDLQNTNLHSTTEPDVFLQWLRPETRLWWDRVDAFWRGMPQSK